MRRFNLVVMSETEPATQDILWLRPKKNTMDESGSTQFDMWYFGETGWCPMADYDTRYNFSASYEATPSSEGLEIELNKVPEASTVDSTFHFSVYDGSREIQSSGNFVLESGLKKEIDGLKNYIDNEVRTLNSKTTELSVNLDTVSSKVISNTDRIAMSEGRLSILES